MFVFRYKFEGSSEIREITSEKECLSGEKLCDLILKKLFQDGPVPCNLFTENVDRSKVTIVQRKYSNKFVTKTDTTKEPGEIEEVKVKVRRWRSRSPKKRRWRSRSPKRYKTVYSIY